MVTRKKPTIKSAESKKKSDASKKGWITRRKNQNKQTTKKSSRPSRVPASEKLRKLQKTEKIRNLSRLKAQKKGKSLASDKPKLNSKKPLRPARRASKKRVSVR